MMETDLDELIRLCPPPARPVGTGRIEDFALIEAELGTPLPADFKQLTAIYGSGSWLKFYWHYNPLANKHDWLHNIRWEYWRAERRDSPQYMPYPIWPEKGGLLPWGGNENGGDLFWLTEGPPDSWITLIRPDRTPEFIPFHHRCTRFLLMVLRKNDPVMGSEFWESSDDIPLFSPG